MVRTKIDQDIANARSFDIDRPRSPEVVCDQIKNSNIDFTVFTGSITEVQSGFKGVSQNFKVDSLGKNHVIKSSYIKDFFFFKFLVR